MIQSHIPTMYDLYPKEYILINNVEKKLDSLEGFINVIASSITKISYKLIINNNTLITNTLTFPSNTTNVNWYTLSSQPFYISHITVEGTGTIILKTITRVAIC